MPLANRTAADLPYLAGMYDDDYFPDHLVDKVKRILLDLCAVIERDAPADLPALYRLTAVATERVNDLVDEFDEAGSEIETVAREEIAEDFWSVAKAYGFADADPEELVAVRDW